MIILLTRREPVCQPPIATTSEEFEQPEPTASPDSLPCPNHDGIAPLPPARKNKLLLNRLLSQNSPGLKDGSDVPISQQTVPSDVRRSKRLKP